MARSDNRPSQISAFSNPRGMWDPSQLPRAAEPFFLAFNANVEFHLLMLGEDLMKAGPSIEQAVKKYS